MDVKKPVGFLLAVATAALLSSCALSQPGQYQYPSGAYNAGVNQSSQHSCKGKNGCPSAP